MPAMLDDPLAPTIYRSSGDPPFPSVHDHDPSTHPLLPLDVYPRQVTLRDRITTATIVPFSSQHQVPPSLLAYLCDQLNREIERGDSYPMIDTMTTDAFAAYWYQNFAAVMLLGSIESADELIDATDWDSQCLGSYYIKPNYPGRSSHICNAGFLVSHAAKNKGVGRLLGESYLDWAPKLGYTYSVFNLVFETNVASCRIWDALGFKRIGRVKGAGNLKSYPGQYIDAIIYGRDLGPDGEDFVSEERFDKIKFYLKYGKYPAGADRAEKSRLRSAATHYKLVPESDKLMLKDKEVIADPQRQYVIARDVHMVHHGGINKTTATIAEKYHWVRIKETVSLVIRNCSSCKELGKAPVVRADGVIRPAPRLAPSPPGQGAVSAAGRVLSLPHPDHSSHVSEHGPAGFEHAGQGSVSPQVLNRSLPGRDADQMGAMQQHPPAPIAPIARMQNDYLPLDPQMMDDALVRHQLGSYSSDPHTHAMSNHHYGEHDPHDPDSFHAMLTNSGHGGRDGAGHDEGGSEDLDMLIDPEEEGDGDGEEEGQRMGKAMMQAQAGAAARAAAEEALKTVG
ncbi:histone acetyltransferase Spt10 [Drepanopeziza brunnea f. sp. 'multigermtubi' MB_m1]|uniref:Histone acetyltransferase Spt10 n=2 Tax=Drepanopeziza brunnea f. sp. 'multigermtubi' TaxID=698441 RepID=K1WJ78_MARBU|nr:histone acetyltransferase Spt10 [Drepanopeziza brunnea f. sp. 'multigermtubi' MB_m1]EKD17685.1 histone acetyltransferase Spt10 [Drepanopeziza brunnea f. sp. 'multigermtubi' MB_m1]